VRCAGAFAVGAALLSLSGVAHAAGGEEGGSASELLWMALNLAILLGVLVYFGRKPLRTFFDERRHQVQRELADANQLRQEVEARLSKWQRRMAELDEEVGRLRGVALEQAEAERERILADARASADRIRREAQAVIEQELLRGREVLRDEAAELTVRLARDLLSRQVSDADRERLLDEFVQSVEQGAARPGNGSGS
jgi:F-type H+-transporting ATPase subunit b